MNINPLNINHNTSKCTPSFKRVQFQGELSKVFAEPEYAMPFVEGLKKLQQTKLNLKEIMQYDKCVGLHKMILNEFFKFIGKDEVEDYTVTIKLEQEPKWNCYQTVLYGASPVRKEDYVPLAGDKNFRHNYKIGDVSYDDTENFYNTGFDLRRTIGMPSINEFKWMLHLRLNWIIRNICDAIECNMDYIHGPSKLATKEDIFRKLERMANEKDDTAIQSMHPDVSETQILQNAYRVYDSTVYRVPAAEYMIKQLFKNAGIDSENTQSYFARVKGDGNIASITSKMSRCMESSESLRNSVKSGKFLDVLEHIYDVYGTRLNADSEEEVNKFYNEFAEFVKAGYIIPVQVNNYHGEGIEPFLSPEQIDELEKITKSLGLDTKYCNTTQKNGYTAVNIRAKIIIEEDTSLPVEFQIRTRGVDKLTTITHYAYDVMNGKDILSCHDSNKQKLLKPLIDKLLIVKNNKKLSEKYNEYFTKCFYIARNGMSDFPNISEYGLPEEVSCANILKIHKLLKSTDENIQEFNQQKSKPEMAEQSLLQKIIREIKKKFTK